VTNEFDVAKHLLFDLDATEIKVCFHFFLFGVGLSTLGFGTCF
jgi:hypothetical protein